MRVLIVAADRMEFTGMMSRLPDSGAPDLPVKFAYTTRLGNHETLLVANGVGARHAGAAVKVVAPKFRPEAIVSTGFCGALDEKLQIADVVLGMRVLAGGRLYAAGALHSGMKVHSGAVSSIDRVAQTAQEKRNLRKSGACAVEMEAAGVAAEAEARDVPFYCVKVVTDLAGETMANDFNAALHSDGHFDTIKLLRESLRHPVVRLPELLRLRRRCARAARALGEFFADCRF